MKIRIPNRIFELRVEPNTIKVYAALLYCTNPLGNAIVKIEKIMELCNISSRSTVYTALYELEEKKLVHKYNRRKADGNYVANGYSIRPIGKEGWFEVDLSNPEVLHMDKSAFLLYCYILKLSKKGTNKVYQSLSKFSKALGICENTVIKSIRYLERTGFIRKKNPVAAGFFNSFFLLFKKVTSPSEKTITEEKRFVKRAPQGLIASFFDSALHFLYSNVLTQYLISVKKKIFSILGVYKITDSS